MINMRRIDEAVHRRVDRWRRSALAMQAVIERRDHLVFALDSGIDVHQPAHPIEAQHREARFSQGAKITAGTLHPDKLDWLTGDVSSSRRDGYVYWMGPEIYGVKWRNFKLALAVQKYSTDPVGKLPSPRIINLVADPQEREPMHLPYLHSWTDDVVAVVLDDDTDWEEVTELVTESYRHCAPQKLARRLDR